MPPMVRLDTDPLQMAADADGISGGSENVASAHLSPAVAGINRDGRHDEPLQSGRAILINDL